MEAEKKEDPRIEFLQSTARKKLQHSTPRRSPARKKVVEEGPTTVTSDEVHEPEDSALDFKKSSRRQKTGRETFRKRPEETGRRREDVWLRRRSANKLKRRTQEPVRNLKSYLLATGRKGSA